MLNDGHSIASETDDAPSLPPFYFQLSRHSEIKDIDIVLWSYSTMPMTNPARPIAIDALGQPAKVKEAGYNILQRRNIPQLAR